jgi:hypothetical protein
MPGKGVGHDEIDRGRGDPRHIESHEGIRHLQDLIATLAKAASHQSSKRQFIVDNHDAATHNWALIGEGMAMVAYLPRQR